MAGMYCLRDLLDLAVRERAEELLLETGKAPVIHTGGRRHPLDLPVLTNDNVADLFSSVATMEQSEELRRCGDIRFIYASDHSGRFAVKASTEGRDFSLKIQPLSGG